MLKKSRQKFNYLENEKSFKDKIKCIFRRFWRAIIEANNKKTFWKVTALEFDFKTLAFSWNEEFKLPDGLYSISYIQYYFEYILKKDAEKTVNPSIRICTNKIEYRITFIIKTGYYLELLTPKTMKLLGSTKSKITKNQNEENLPYLEITEVVLIHRNVVYNSYQQNSRVLYTFVPNKRFGQLLDI